MKFRFLFLILSGLLFAGSVHSYAQIVGTDVFLQGHWLEVGVDDMGAFGTCSSPAGYHVHGPAVDEDSTCFDAGDELDACYDWGHDGWGVGIPCEMGDYTIPGYPQEGWGLQVAGTEYDNWAGGGACTGTFNVPGSITGYSNSGGIITGTFTGAAAGLNIIQESRVDTEASWVVITTRIYNTTPAPITGVYYERTCDPDNTSFWPGGSSETENVIVHQNEDATHRVMIGTYGTSSGTEFPSPTVYTYNRYNSWLSLATKDCRARCMVLESLFPTYPDDTISALWHTGESSTLVTLNQVNDSNSADEGIALVYNIGTIAALGSPGDSAIISYAYIYDGPDGIDSAFPDPQLLVNTAVAVNSAEPLPTYDTFTSCANPGVNSIPVKILHATDKDWSWSTWTWSPSTGLAATTGVSNTINIASLSGPTTYTITGTDSAVNMMSCNYRVFYLTILPCLSDTSNSPPGSAICLSDTLKLVAHGDSTGATYFWYGPGGFTSTGQSTIRTGLTMADTGLYYVVKTIGGSSDTVHTEVALKPLPVVTASSNGPVCSGVGNTLLLTATPDSVGETFTWTGPDGFSSGIQNPPVTAPPVSASGIYRVITILNGCVDSGFVTVVVDSTPAIPGIGSNSPICSQRDTLKFTSRDATAGVSYSWSGPLGFATTLQNPMILPDVHVPPSGTYTVTGTIMYGDLVCSSSNTTVAVIDSTPYLPVLGSNSPVCSGNPLLLTASSTTGATYSWVGPNVFTSGLQNPTIDPVPTIATGTYYVSATIVYPGIPRGCISDTATLPVVIDSTPVIPAVGSNSPGPPGPTLCQMDTLRLTATDLTAGVSYSWAGPDAFTSTEENPLLINVSPASTGSYTVTAILGICNSTAITPVVITPSPPLTATNNGPVCTGIADTLLLQAFSGPGATYSWAGPYTFSSLNQNPFRTPVIAEYAGVYQVTAFLDGCPSAVVNDTVVVRLTPAPPIVPYLTYCQFYSTPALQAMGDSILWYPNALPGAVGTLTQPVPSTSNAGTSWYYASQTILSCTSAIDSIRVVVNPKPIVTVTSDTSVCPHGALTLTATDTDPLAYYHWSPSIYMDLDDTAAATVVINPETNVLYSVVALNQFGCADTAQVMVNVYAAAVLDLGDSVTLYPGDSYQINTATNCTSFAWFPPSGLDNPTIANPVATPLLSTKYIVQGETSWGCIAVDSISIYVDPGISLALPNAFTPGNGPNSTFKIIKRGMATLKYFRIFDRWGVMVFETTDVDAGWDGTYNGTPQPFGVYVYEVEATSNTGDDFAKHGNVTLIR